MNALTEFLKAKGAPRTKVVYRAAISAFLAHVYDLEREKDHYTDEEKQRIESFSSQYLKEIQAGSRSPARDLMTFTGSLHGRPRRTAKVYVSAVTGWLIFNDIELSEKKTRAVKENLPKGGDGRIGFKFDRDGISRILAFSDLPMKAAILVLASSGMRDGELLALRPEDVDMDQDHEPHGPVKVTIRKETTKTKTGRITYISTEAARVVRLWLEKREDYIKNKAVFKTRKGNIARIPITGQNRADRLFPFSYGHLRNSFTRTLARAGIQNTGGENGRKPIKIHKFRAFFRTEFVKAGGNALDVCETVLGHGGYLPEYRLLSDKDIAETYRRAEKYLTIEAPVEVSSEEIDAIKKENEHLKKRLEDLEAARIKNQEAQQDELFKQILARLQREGVKITA